MKMKYFVPVMLLALIMTGCNNSGGTPTPTVTIDSITVNKNPDKVSYTVGEYFDPTGLVLTANMSNETSELISYADHKDEITYSPTTALAETDTIATISYKGLSTTVAITVSKASSSDTLLIDFNSFVFQSNSKEISTTSSGDSYPDALKAFVNVDDTYLGEIITSGYSGIKKLDYEVNDFVPFTILQLASGTDSAELTLRFTKTIKSVKIKAQAYYKAYMKTWNLDGGEPYAIYSLDGDTTFSVNGTDWELPSVELNDDYEIVAAPQIVEKTFDNINSRDLTLDDGEYIGRTFIHSIELTF